MNLQNAKALVTGGSSGIGYEIARRLIAKGAKVAITGRNAEKLEKAAQELGAISFVADVSDEKAMQEVVKNCITQLGGLNVLVNNAAYGYFSPITEIDTQQFNELISTNVTGLMITTRECAKHFVAQQSGNIINISSTAGRKGFANGSPYVATKFAVAGMTECWRDELRKHNIRVMLINPSEVQTNFVVNSGRPARPFNETKLQATEIAHTAIAMLEMEDRGFITEATVWATNPVN